jgi:hypothetical protein
MVSAAVAEELSIAEHAVVFMAHLGERDFLVRRSFLFRAAQPISSNHDELRIRSQMRVESNAGDDARLSDACNRPCAIPVGHCRSAKRTDQMLKKYLLIRELHFSQRFTILFTIAPLPAVDSIPAIRKMFKKLAT